MRVPQRIRSIAPPAIAMINSHAERLQREGAQVISLGLSFALLSLGGIIGSYFTC